jgi:hypothetical protein
MVGPSALCRLSRAEEFAFSGFEMSCCGFLCITVHCVVISATLPDYLCTHFCSVCLTGRGFCGARCDCSLWPGSRYEPFEPLLPDPP